MGKAFAAAFFIVAVLSACNPAHASLVWDWALDNPTQIVSQTDYVVMNATLSNDPSSTVVMKNLDSPLVSGVLSGTGNFDTAYTYYQGPLAGNGFYDQFSGLVLQLGETFQFVIGYFAPTNGPVPPGTLCNTIYKCSFHGWFQNVWPLSGNRG